MSAWPRYLHRAYLELDGGERGGPLDIARALGHMVAYNGGRFDLSRLKLC